MATRIKLRRDITANWMDVNPILASGEMGIEADTRRMKIGDGSTAWNDLKYAVTDQLRVDGKTINSEMGVSIASQDPETWISKVKARANWAGTSGVAYDSMGNLYLSGWEEYDYDIYSGNGKCFLTKFDSQGAVLWSKYTQLNGYSNGAGVAVDSEDNVIAITVDWDDDYYAITKYTEDGTVIWQKTYEDGYDWADGVAVETDSNNDIILVGQRADPDHDDNRALFLMKLSGTDGSITWCKTVGRWNGGTNQPCVAVDGSNNIIVAGWDDVYSNGRVFIWKFDTTGSTVWSKTIDNPENQWDGYELVVGSIDADADGNIYFVGSYMVPNFVTDLSNDTWDGRAGLVLKMNSESVIQWSKLVGPGDCSDMGAQVVYNDGRVYATFQTERKYYTNDQSRNNSDGYTTQEIVVACWDAVSGQVIWQNNFGPDVLWGYSNPSGNPDNYQDTSNWAGRMIAVYKDYVAVAGQAGEYSRTNDTDTRSYGFVAQLPADGTEMDLAGWNYKESKHRGLYAKVTTGNYTDYSVHDTTDITVTGTNEYTPQDTADNVRIELLAAGSNQWDFKPNGDLALPVGGNIEISRATQGDINVVGYFDSDNDRGIFNVFTSVTTDANGNKYYVGQWNVHDNNTYNGNKSLPLVVKVNAQGQVEWKSRLSNYNLYDSYSVDGMARCVAYDPSSGNIVVVCTDSGEGNAEQMLIVDMDPVNGDVIESKRYSGGDDIRANSIVINTDGERFITGSIEGDNYLSFTVTNAMVASTATVNTLMVPRSVFGEHTPPTWLDGTNGWYVDGIGNVNTIDLYENISGTVRQGSGAVFTVSASTGSYTAVATTAGTNYRVGHKILVTGDQLGGSSSTNTCTIVVNTINGSGGILTANAYGVSTGTNTYTGITGANYNVGSGFTIDVQVNANTTTNNLVVYHNQGGTNYVVGDVITFPGTSIGGTNPETNIVITALQVGGFTGDVQPVENTGYTVTTRGVSPLTYVRLEIDSSPNFTTGGPWYLLHYTNANTFLAKFNPVGSTATNLVWAKWIEKADYDQGLSVDYDSDGNIYWMSRVYDTATTSTLNTQDMPLLAKVSPAGDLLWAKSYINTVDGSEGTAMRVQVDSGDKPVISYSAWYQSYYSWTPIVARLTADGEPLWSKRIWIDGGEGYSHGLALDSDDNIYVAQGNNDGEDNTLWAQKLDIQNGDVIWQQQISNENRDIYGWDNEFNLLSTDGEHYQLAGWTRDLDGNEGNAFAASLPVDGSAADTQQGPFAITETFYGTEGNNLTFDTRDTYSLTTATMTLVTNRAPIRSWIETGPTSYYPVYTKSAAGIVFGDGTVQTTSGEGLPQVRHNRYDKDVKLKLSDAGKHLYMSRSEQRIIVPIYSEVPFPVGTVITIVNISGGYVYVGAGYDNGRTRLYCPDLDGYEGNYGYVAGWKFYDQSGGNLIKLLKVEESYSNGSRWIVTGNNGSRWN